MDARNHPQEQELVNLLFDRLAKWKSTPATRMASERLIAAIERLRLLAVRGDLDQIEI